MKKVERFSSLILMGEISLVCSGENRLKRHHISLLHSFIAQLPKWLFPHSGAETKLPSLNFQCLTWLRQWSNCQEPSAMHLAQKKSLEGQDREALISQALYAIPFRLSAPAKDKSSMVCGKALRRRGSSEEKDVNSRFLREPSDT